MNYELVIRVENGQIIGHPLTMSNLSSLIPNLDPYNLPPEYRYFERVEQPDVKWYEKNLSLSYEFSGDIVKDIWTVDVITDEEKQQIKSNLISQWLSMTGWSSWAFDENTGTFNPPVPRPEDGKNYQWDENTTNWTEVVEE